MRLVFASDHAGFELRQKLAAIATANGHQVVSVGATSTDAFDYPDAADQGVAEIQSNRADLGIFICGSGIGISIRANRFPKIRAANCCSEQMAELARKHNQANVLCLGERIVSPELATKILETFLNTEPDFAERHQNRVNKLDASTAC
ncbi:MAG: ribose 5-phosphate isomerase B [Armatimonadetes bacterium]|nr:ribose 5-phosphate isomerase B [Armatimonadota bacterium]